MELTNIILLTFQSDFGNGATCNKQWCCAEMWSCQWRWCRSNCCQSTCMANICKKCGLLSALCNEHATVFSFLLILICLWMSGNSKSLSLMSRRRTNNWPLLTVKIYDCIICVQHQYVKRGYRMHTGFSNFHSNSCVTGLRIVNDLLLPIVCREATSKHCIIYHFLP